MKNKTKPASRPRTERPRPPFPRQHQRKPGLESKLTPRPRYEAALYRPAGKLEGRTALITGGDSGIGRAVAVMYAKEGADCAIVYLPEEQSDADETRRAVEGEGRRCVLLPGDVKDPSFCEKAAAKAARELGGLHILVNNAAFQQHQDKPEDLTPQQWDLTFRTNIHAYFYMVRAALPHLEKGASIINCSSVTALRGSKELLDYSSTKGAIETFTKSLSQSLMDRGIRVNSVAPGPVWTPLNAADRPPEKVSTFGEKAPMKRPAQPEEVAPAFVFLASEADSGYISGETIAVQGGEIVR